MRRLCDGAQSGNYFGKLRSNFVGTEFTVYDKGVKPSEAETCVPYTPSVAARSCLRCAECDGCPRVCSSSGVSQLAARCELGAVLYQYNVLGTRGPRKMTAIVPQACPLAATALLLRRGSAGRGLNALLLRLGGGGGAGQRAG